MFERMTREEFVQWQKDQGTYESYKSTPMDERRVQEFFDSYEEGYTISED